MTELSVNEVMRPREWVAFSVEVTALPVEGVVESILSVERNVLSMGLRINCSVLSEQRGITSVHRRVLSVDGDIASWSIDWCKLSLENAVISFGQTSLSLEDSVLSFGQTSLSVEDSVLALELRHGISDDPAAWLFISVMPSIS